MTKSKAAELQTMAAVEATARQQWGSNDGFYMGWLFYFILKNKHSFPRWHTVLTGTLLFSISKEENFYSRKRQVYLFLLMSVVAVFRKFPWHTAFFSTWSFPLVLQVQTQGWENDPTQFLDYQSSDCHWFCKEIAAHYPHYTPSDTPKTWRKAHGSPQLSEEHSNKRKNKNSHIY